MSDVSKIIEYLVSFNFDGRTLVLVEAPRGARFEDVLRCAVGGLRGRYGYEARARLADRVERPESWKTNPIVWGEREVWMLVAVWVQWDGLVPGVEFQVEGFRCQVSGEEAAG